LNRAGDGSGEQEEGQCEIQAAQVHRAEIHIDVLQYRDELTALAGESRRSSILYLFFPLAVSLQAFGTLFAGPGMELRAFAFVFEERNAVAAGVGDAVDFDDDDGAHAVVRREVCRQRGEFRLVRFDDMSAAIRGGRCLAGPGRRRT